VVLGQRAEDELKTGDANLFRQLQDQRGSASCRSDGSQDSGGFDLSLPPNWLRSIGFYWLAGDPGFSSATPLQYLLLLSGRTPMAARTSSARPEPVRLDSTRMRSGTCSVLPSAVHAR